MSLWAFLGGYMVTAYVGVRSEPAYKHHYSSAFRFDGNGPETVQITDVSLLCSVGANFDC